MVYEFFRILFVLRGFLYIFVLFSVFGTSFSVVCWVVGGWVFVFMRLFVCLEFGFSVRFREGIEVFDVRFIVSGSV